MIDFEWYISRARIDLGLFFKVENINSDKELADYCRSKNLSLPKSKYFSEDTENLVKTIESNPEQPKPITKPSVSKPRKRRVAKKTEGENLKPVESKVEKPKPPRKTRRRTTKKKTTK